MKIAFAAHALTTSLIALQRLLPKPERRNLVERPTQLAYAEFHIL
jgi:hypothetical protein